MRKSGAYKLIEVLHQWNFLRSDLQLICAGLQDATHLSYKLTSCPSSSVKTLINKKTAYIKQTTKDKKQKARRETANNKKAHLGAP